MFFNEPYDIQQVNENLFSYRIVLSIISTVPKLKIHSTSHEKTKRKTQYDYIVIDTPPGLGARITAAVLEQITSSFRLNVQREAIEGMVELRDTIRVS